MFLNLKGKSTIEVKFVERPEILTECSMARVAKPEEEKLGEQQQAVTESLPLALVGFLHAETATSKPFLRNHSAWV